MQRHEVCERLIEQGEAGIGEEQKQQGEQPPGATGQAADLSCSILFQVGKFIEYVIEPDAELSGYFAKSKPRRQERLLRQIVYQPIYGVGLFYAHPVQENVALLRVARTEEGLQQCRFARAITAQQAGNVAPFGIDCGPCNNLFPADGKKDIFGQQDVGDYKQWCVAHKQAMNKSISNEMNSNASVVKEM